MKEGKFEKANDIKENIKKLKNIVYAMSNERGRIAYVKWISSNGWAGYEMNDDELQKELLLSTLTFCTKKIQKLEKEFENL
jgi:hypothetical protein